MDSNKNSPQPPKHEAGAFSGWGTFAGAGVGLVLGLFAGHWLAWAASFAFVGWISGAMIDRSRLR